jgi:hypothetical protein
MSKTLSVGFTDTPIPDVTTLSLTRGLVNFGADYRVKSSTAGEVVVTNLTSPVDRPERFRIAFSEVANVYSGSGIDPTCYAPSKKGVSVLIQLTDIYSVTDDTDASYRVDLPVSAHLVLKIPSNENITSDAIQALVGRLVSGLYDTGSEETTRIVSLIRGSLTPSDL